MRGLAYVCLTLATHALVQESQASGKARSASDLKGDPMTQSIMQQVFVQVAEVLPLSFDDAAFRSPSNKTAIKDALNALKTHAQDLEKHTRGKDRSLAYVARSFKEDARNLSRYFDKGAYEEAQFTLHNMTDNCITCHSSLPESHKVPPAEAFFKAVKIEALHPVERAHFYVMSRQFDQALATYEDYFTKTVPPSSYAGLGSFADYLKVSAQVKSDLARPRRMLEAALSRSELKAPAREQLQKWVFAIDGLQKERALEQTSLTHARRILDEGKRLMEFPRDRDGLIHYLVASAILQRYVHEHQSHGIDVAEAYYMLGITEPLLSQSFWVSRSDFYLETAIRFAPAATFAPKAYRLLEESYTVGFSGSSGTHIPDDVQALLSELHELIVQAQGSKA